jgi:3-deoxy-D-manno-octulosonic-acid transferase
MRPVLLAASTHCGEDETILPAHDALRRQYPYLLTIVAPRHPARGAEIAMLCGTRAVLQRSQNALPGPDTAVYVADTIGELSLFYTVAPFAFIGGSLVAHGGQNPLEAALLERAVIAGPHTENFTQAYEAIFAAQGGGRVHSCAEITALAGRWYSNPDVARAAGLAAASAVAELGGALEITRQAVEALLLHAAP